MALSTFVTSSGLSMLLLALASNVATSSAAPSPNGITDILLPSPNVTGGPVAEIQCYALPYGAVGIISHLLTYWTIAWMAVGKVPIWPGHEMKHWRFDLFLAIAALCTCIPIASITIHRCRLSWHFILIGIWKLVTSVSVACISIHRCILVHQGKNNRRPLLWLLLYLAGTAVGMTGLCSLLWTSFRQDQTVRNLTYGFAAPMILIPVLVAIHWFVKHLDLKEGGGAVWLSAILSTLSGAVVAFATVFGFFSALYGDLVLGAIADNLLGLPSADFAPLYWVWFIAKRLPMLSF